MSLTLDTMLDNCRDYMQDKENGGTFDPYRYPDDSLIRLTNEAIREIRRLRPDIFVGCYSEPLQTFSISDVGQNIVIQLPDEVVGAIAFYVVATAQTRDDEYTTEGRAAAFMAQFYRNIGMRAA